MITTCGCGGQPGGFTPLAITNRPGLTGLSYRVGTYATFFATMKSRLSSQQYAALHALRTRDVSDPVIALLDSWAVVADVLTFYQERIANEGYIRTATERQSVIYLSELVGYFLAPGVSASVYLAYTVDPTSVPAAELPSGTRVQSMPSAQGGLPQTFETEAPLTAQNPWNNLVPRLQQPQLITSGTSEFYVNGVNSNLKANDAVAIVASAPVLRRIASVEQQFDARRTKVDLQSIPSQSPTAGTAQPQAPASNAAAKEGSALVASTVDLVSGLRRKHAGNPANPLRLPRQLSSTFAADSDSVPAMLGTLFPTVHTQMYAGLRNMPAEPSSAQIHALRVQAAPFGATAPQRMILDKQGTVVRMEEWPVAGSTIIRISIGGAGGGRGGIMKGPMLSERLKGEEATVNIGITDPKNSAAASLPIASNKTPQPIGSWNVVVEVSQSELKLSFSPTPLPTIAITANQGDSVTVKTDGGISLTVPAGMTATQENGGTRAAVSLTDSLEISYEIPLTPDDKTLELDSIYDQITPGSLLFIQRPDWPEPRSTQVEAVRKSAVTRYNVSAKVTVLTLQDPWLDAGKDLLLSAVRQAVILTQSEQLDIAPEPVTEDVAGDTIELGSLYSDLQPGRWLIVKGERTDLPNTTGVTGSEVVMLAGVQQGVKQIATPAPPAGTAAAGSGSSPALVPLPGDTLHSFITLSRSLTGTYKRGTVSVFGNVIRATHGESRSEVLGSGDGSQSLQKFRLHYPQVTHVSTPSGNGSQSTLQVTVNDVPWREVDSLASAGPIDKVYMTKTDASDMTTIQFGDGIHGMRLPTGMANVKANYRSGTGTPGNVDGDKITLLSTRPLGVKSVTNPIGSTAGADAESTDQARTNASASTASLDRLVSIGDYVDYARSFAGIGKADAAHLSDGSRQIVFVTVAGSEGTILEEDSDPVVNLAQAFQQIGDPHLPIQVGIAESILLVISAQVQLKDGYQWEDVAPAIRAAVNAAFSFDARNLGEWVFMSGVTTVIQNVDGVAFVLVPTLNKLSEEDALDKDKLAAALAAISQGRSLEVVRALRARRDAHGVLHPAQVVYLSPDIPDTFILAEIGQ